MINGILCQGVFPVGCIYFSMCWKILTSRETEGDIKYSNPSQSKYNRQETHAVMIFSIYKCTLYILLFSSVSKTNFIFAVSFYLSSAYGFNSDQSKYLTWYWCQNLDILQYFFEDF